MLKRRKLLVGIEPTIFRLEGGRDIHFATGASPPEGVEPSTDRLRADRSTTELWRFNGAFLYAETQNCRGHTCKRR